MTSEIIDPQLDYKKRTVSRPNYKFTKILPLQNIPASPNTLINTAGGQVITFQLPVVAMNLAKSMLNFTITPAAGTTFNEVFMDCLPVFQQIQLLNNQGVELCNLIYPQNYTKVIWKAEIPFSEYNNYSIFQSGGSAGRFLRKSNALASNATASNYAIRPTSFGGDFNGVVNYTENAYLTVSASGSEGPLLNVSLPLGMLKNTVFSLDKDIYFNEIMTLQLTFGPAAKVGFNCADLADPSDTAASMTTVDVTNVSLLLATEKDIILTDILKKMVAASQFNIPIPYVHSIRTPMGATTSQNVALTLTRGHGQRLLKIYHSIFPGTETLNNVYNNSMNTTQLVDFYTQVNDQRLQDFNVRRANSEDWILMQQKLEGSITQTYGIYAYNWFWVDDFTGLDKLAEASKLDMNILQGMSLDQNVYYQFNANTSATAFTHYDFVITQKMLSITPQGMFLN